MCVCVPFTGTYVKTLSRGCRWALFLPAGSTGVKQNNWLIYLYEVLFRVSHFTQQSSWQLFSCHTRMASSYFNGIKTKITKTVCQITNANPVQLMLNVLKSKQTDAYILNWLFEFQGRTSFHTDGKKWVLWFIFLLVACFLVHKLQLIE